VAAPVHQHVTSERKLVEEVLAPCPLCFIEGPPRRLAEHMQEDHGGGGNGRFGWAVSIDPALRGPLDALRVRHKLTFAALINAAVAQQLARVERRR